MSFQRKTVMGSAIMLCFSQWLLWCGTRGRLIQLTNPEKVSWKGLTRRNEKLTCFESILYHLSDGILRLCCSQPVCPGYWLSCRAVLLHQPWPYLSIWDHGVLSLTVLYITSPCPHWPLPWSPSKSVDITGIFNSIMCCLGVWDTNIYARALKLGQLLWLSIKDKLNLKLSLPSWQNTSYP